MENLLRTDFTAHYGLLIATVTHIYQETNAAYFEIEDDTHKETQITFTRGTGTAAYNNSFNNFLMGVINYDKFVTSLPNTFQRGRKRCDLIVYTKNDREYFLLNELKDAKRKRSPQLIKSLTDLLSVPSIQAFANTFTKRRCCFFNKRVQSPPSISAIAAFNRVNTIAANGFQIQNAEMEALGFTFYKYYGGHQFQLI